MTTAYITLEELQQHYGEDTVTAVFDKEGVGEVHVETLDHWIATAGAEIDSSLRGRYQLPIEPRPDELVPIAARLVMEGGYQAQGAPEHIKYQAELARKQLREYANGTRRLAISTDGEGGDEQPNNAFGSRKTAKKFPTPGSLDDAVNQFSGDRGTNNPWRQ